ncbi:hypothetical protein [Nostoc sp.]|uniref:hypothetical protein n=1 Tax=Nostoc sp. TaxID=1180 RepID=UPI002FF8415D
MLRTVAYAVLSSVGNLPTGKPVAYGRKPTKERWTHRNTLAPLRNRIIYLFFDILLIPNL